MGLSIARQQWRARIETVQCLCVRQALAASPASNGGRGLKQVSAKRRRDHLRIARQQWRARIETLIIWIWWAVCAPHRPPAMAGAD